MSKKKVGAFTIESIECFNWKLGSGSALVRATNLEGDSVEFSIYRHPEDFTVAIIEDVEVLSTVVQPYEVKDIVEREIQVFCLFQHQVTYEEQELSLDDVEVYLYLV